MQIKSFQDENLKNKIVLLRTDYNVPTNDKVVVDTTRIDESIPTINALLKMGAKIIIITHRGRPKGQIDISLSMEPIARELEKKINRNVKFINRLDEDITKHEEEIFLFENIKFRSFLIKFRFSRPQKWIRLEISSRTVNWEVWKHKIATFRI